MKNVTRLLKSHVSQSLITEGSIAILSVLTLMWLTRILPLHVFGEWAVYISCVSLVDMLRTGLLKIPFIYFSSIENNFNQNNSNAFILGLLVNSVLLIILALCYVFFEPYRHFIIAYSLLMFTDLPYTFAIYEGYVDLNYRRIFYIKFYLKLLFLGATFFLTLDINSLLFIHVFTSFILSLLYGNKHMMFYFYKYYDRVTLYKFFNYGRYTLGNLVGTSLLKNTDLYIIAFYLTSEDVALYAVGIKAIDFLEYPIRAIGNVFFPTIAKLCSAGEKRKMKAYYIQFICRTTLVLLPLITALFIFSEYFISIIAGEAYIASSQIFSCFLIYTLFLPLDKFSGVFLDSIKRPELKKKKIYLMFLLNLVGDFLAIILFESSLAIAFVSIATFTFGAFYSIYWLRKILEIHFAKELFKEAKYLFCLRAL